MTVVIGNKRRKIQDSQTDTPSTSIGLGPKSPSESGNEEDDSEDVQAIFRRHFEAQFRPLETGEARHGHERLSTKRIRREDEVEDDKAVSDEVEEETNEGSSGSEKEEDEWDGFSEDEEPTETRVVEIIDHTGNSGGQRDFVDKAAKRKFMSSKPPSLVPKPQPSADPKSRSKSKAAKNDSESDDESSNLANDLALQRLLRESHLLDSNPNAGLAPTGSARHKAQDLAFQSLGSKSSILEQRNMPMGQRKGIVAAKKEREDKRRREARENGIVLEVAKKGTQRKGALGKRRDRGVGAPSVGKLKGATLRLSRGDLNEIQGPPDKLTGRKKGRSR